MLLLTGHPAPSVHPHSEQVLVFTNSERQLSSPRRAVLAVQVPPALPISTQQPLHIRWFEYRHLGFVLSLLLSLSSKGWQPRGSP